MIDECYFFARVRLGMSDEELWRRTTMRRLHRMAEIQNRPYDNRAELADELALLDKAGL